MILTLLLLLACSDKDGDDTAGGPGPGDGGTTSDGGATGDGGTSGDGGGTGGDGGTTGDGGGTGGDVWDLVDPDNCTDLDGFEDVPGAASYFVGEYSPAGGPTSGTETWALYANPVWEAAGGADCVVVWTMSASSASPGACGSCDYGLSVSASIDSGATTCAADLYRGDESWTATYGVDEKPDGTATWHFASSGDQFGAGFVTAGGVSFVTPDSCAWFGR